MNEQPTYREEPKFKVGEVISQAWKYTKENIGFFIGYFVITFLVSFLFSFIATKLSDRGRDILSLLMHIAGWIVGIFIQMGFVKSALLITSGVKPGFNQLFANDKYFISYLVSNILYNLMVIIGLILLIIPGVYLAVRYLLFQYFILDKDMGPIESLEAASRASEGKRGFIFWLSCVLILLNIAGALLLGVGLLITIPITILSFAIVYRKLVHDHPEVTIIPD